MRVKKRSPVTIDAKDRYRNTLASIGDGVISTDAQGCIDFMNPAAERLTGWSETEAKGRPTVEVFKTLHEETRVEMESSIARVLREGPVVGSADHTLLIARDGKEWPIADSAAPIHNESGAVTGVVLVFRDQTDARRVEEALRKSEEKYRKTIADMSEGFYSVTLDGKLLDHNREFNRILGFGLEESQVGAQLPDFWRHPEERQAYLDEFNKRGVILSYPIAARKKNGEMIFVEVCSRLIKDGQGRPSHIEGVFIDVTARKKVEFELQIKNQAFEDSIASQSIADKDGVITHVNSAFLRLWGYDTKKEAIGKSVGAFFANPADAAPVLQALARHDAWEGEFLAVRTDGTTFLAHGLATSLRKVDGELVGYQSTNLDVTSERRTEEALHRAAELTRVGHWEWNIQTNELIWSREVFRLYGIDENTKLELDAGLDQVHPQDRESLERKIKESIDQKKPYRHEFRVIRADGSVAWCDSLGEHIWSQTGQVIAMRGSIQNITERKLAEEALKASLEDFRLVADYTHDWGYWISEDKQYKYISPNCTNISGYSPDEFINEPGLMVTITHPDDRERLARHLTDDEEVGKECEPFEFRILTKGGDERWIDHVCLRVYAGNGKYLGRRGNNRDITEGKRAEEALRESEMFARSTLDALSAHIAIIDQFGNIVAVNRAWREFADENPPVRGNVCEGANYLDICDGAASEASEAAEFAGAIRSVLHGGAESFEMEYACHSPEERRWFIGRVTRFPDSNTPRVVVAHEDITKQKLSDARLARSEQRYGLVINGINDGLWDWNLVTDEVYFSSRWKSMIGYEDDEISGNFSEWENRVHPDDLNNAKKVVQDHLIGKTSEFRLEHRLLHKDGKYRWILARGICFRDQNGSPIRMVGSHTDIDKQKRMEEQLYQAQKIESVGSLAGGVAHDFNNLLSVILSYTELAMDTIPEGSPPNNDLLEVKKAAERAAALTRQLLAFSRKQILQPVALSLNEIVEGIKKMLRRIVGEDIDFVQILSPDLGIVQADPGQIEQVIMNLVVNARDAMPWGGMLTIETANVEIDEEYAAGHLDIKPGSWVQLAVTDTGCGMDEQTKAKLFEPFFTTKAKGKGTGLGLSMVHGIVKQSGGNIWVYTEVGKGTTFKIYLPRELAATTTTAVNLPTVPRRLTGTETILVVEDEESLRRVARRALEAAGYMVLTAADGDEAISMCAQHDGDIRLLLTDVVMPGSNGKKLAQELLKTRQRLKILYMSGYTDDTIFRHGVLDPGTYFISKPFTGEALARKVREVLDGGITNDAEAQEHAIQADAETKDAPLDKDEK